MQPPFFRVKSVLNFRGVLFVGRCFPETPRQGPKAVNGILRQVCRQVHGTANDVDTNVAPEVPPENERMSGEKGTISKGYIVFQASFFRGYVGFQGR